MKKITAFITISLIMVGLAGCNTIQGIGKDVKKAGEVVESAGKK